MHFNKVLVDNIMKKKTLGKTLGKKSKGKKKTIGKKKTLGKNTILKKLISDVLHSRKQVKRKPTLKKSKKQKKKQRWVSL
jgi:6-phosphogluconate dehydrogenase